MGGLGQGQNLGVKGGVLGVVDAGYA